MGGGRSLTQQSPGNSQESTVGTPAEMCPHPVDSGEGWRWGEERWGRIERTNASRDGNQSGKNHAQSVLVNLPAEQTCDQ